MHRLTVGLLVIKAANIWANYIAVIKSGGYKISALDVEREVLGLSYISEAMAVGVEDEEFGQRVAIAVILKKSVRGLNFRLRKC